jgi:hypothetical protein
VSALLESLKRIPRLFQFHGISPDYSNHTCVEIEVSQCCVLPQHSVLRKACDRAPVMSSVLKVLYNFLYMLSFHSTERMLEYVYVEPDCQCRELF